MLTRPMVAPFVERDRVVMRMVFGIVCLMLTAMLGFVERVAAQDLLDILRDAEIENTLRAFATPVWKAAGLDPQAVHVYLVNDPSLNSFVAGGQNIFLNSGTILRATTPNQLIGIMAHETGHMAHGDLARSTQVMHNATIESVIGMVLGAAASALGHGNAGGAGVLAGANVGEQAYRLNSIVVEASADQAALRFLDMTHQSARGLLEFFQVPGAGAVPHRAAPGPLSAEPSADRGPHQLRPEAC